MVFELHVLGPALGLPSLDPECIALIALLSLPLTKNLDWKLVIAHDSSDSPNGDFPLLRHHGKTLAGFRAIVKFLKSLHNDVDEGLTDQQRAAVSATIAHLRLKAQPLVDAHLYADGQNYVHSTRPAFSHLLPFPYSWLSPPHRADKATSRSGHLAAQSSILPFSMGDQPAEDPSIASTTSPSLLFARGQKARASLAQQVSMVRIRLASAADALCEPLAELLELDKDKRGGLWLIRGKFPTSADCLAFGYLALLLEPDVPNKAVTEILQERWPRVVQYYQTLKGVLSLERTTETASALTTVPRLSDDQTAPYDAQRHAAQMRGLPWFRAPAPTLLQRAIALAQVVANAIVSPEQQRHLRMLVQSRSSPLLAIVTAGSSLSVATVAYAIYTLTLKKGPSGIPTRMVFEHARHGATVLGKYGEAGAILGLGSGLAR